MQDTIKELTKSNGKSWEDNFAEAAQAWSPLWHSEEEETPLIQAAVGPCEPAPEPVIAEEIEMDAPPPDADAASDRGSAPDSEKDAEAASQPDRGL